MNPKKRQEKSQVLHVKEWSINHSIQKIIAKQDSISKPAFWDYPQQEQKHLDSPKKRAAHPLIVLGF